MRDNAPIAVWERPERLAGKWHDRGRVKESVERITWFGADES